MDGHLRIKLGRMLHPVRGFLHGTAAVVSLVGAVLLAVLADVSGFGHRMALLVFGLSLVGLFTVSSLYHSIPWREVWKRRMQRLDHTMIQVLVAGTYTPIAVILFDGWLQWVTLGVQWGLVAVGAVQKFVFKGTRGLSIALATTQGWLALLLLWPMAVRIPWTGIMLILLGGILYTVGMIFLVTNRPRLWPRVFSYHEVFHVLVVAAAGVHFAAVAAYVA
jgi:hemolysin III